MVISVLFSFCAVAGQDHCATQNSITAKGCLLLAYFIWPGKRVAKLSQVFLAY